MITLELTAGTTQAAIDRAAGVGALVRRGHRTLAGKSINSYGRKATWYVAVTGMAPR